MTHRALAEGPHYRRRNRLPPLRVCPTSHLKISKCGAQVLGAAPGSCSSRLSTALIGHAQPATSPSPRPRAHARLTASDRQSPPQHTAFRLVVNAATGLATAADADAASH